MEKLRVLITDDDPLVRVALSHFVSRDPDVTVIGEAENGEEAIAAIEALEPEDRPEVVMIDVMMPVMGGIEATERIKERWPEIRVLAVTTLDSREAVIPMLSAGAIGYILKESKAEEILAALKQAYEGVSPLSPRVAAMLVDYVRSAGPVGVRSELPPLTDREQAVLQSLAKGMSNAEMANALMVSEGTIKAHLGSIMSKWNVRDRVQVLVAAARAGLIRFQ
ncbi:MAG: response regulator transcription factor [Scrofimicrobium sp.]